MNAIAPIAQAALAESPALVIQEGPAALMAAIIQFASNPAMDLDKFDRLIALQERAEDRQAERAFNVGFVELQGKLPRIRRDGTLEYPEDKNRPEGPKRAISKYAKWETIDAGVRPALTATGFALSFKIAQRGEGGGLNVSAVLRHIGGHKEIGDPFPVPLDTSGGKNNAQAYGSSLSYGKKYAAFAALNIVTEGDDTDGRTEPTASDGRITDAQAEELWDLMERGRIREGAVIEKMCPGLRSITQLPAADLGRVRNALLSRLNVLEQRAAAERAAAARQTHNGDAR